MSDVQPLLARAIEVKLNAVTVRRNTCAAQSGNTLVLQVSLLGLTGIVAVDIVMTSLV